jgi:DNA-binding NarL/FixJ family response regulator
MRPVLIVEDHPLVAEATGHRLTQCSDDLYIVICSNASQTLALLSRGKWIGFVSFWT